MPSSSSSMSASSALHSSLLLALLLLCQLAALSQAYPAFYIQQVPRQHHGGPSSAIGGHAAPQKRAFDRLDVSPFDFDAMTKRFSDDELLALPYDDLYAIPSLEVPRKRAFDRLEDSGFFGLQKRAFDRLDNSFMLLKRNGAAV